MKDKPDYSMILNVAIENGVSVQFKSYPVKWNGKGKDKRCIIMFDGEYFNFGVKMETLYSGKPLDQDQDKLTDFLLGFCRDINYPIPLFINREK